MKRILYLSFYFEPDLCAGSFRNTPLVKELSKQAKGKAEIDLYTTMPNRYKSFSVKAPEVEKYDNFTVYRIPVPQHKSGMLDQALTFRTYFSKVLKKTRKQDYDLVVASSSRLFTAFLGYILAKKNKSKLVLDIRDIFYDTIEDVLSNSIKRTIILPFIKMIEKRTFSYTHHINLISKGFEPYFQKYTHPVYSFYPNGIDNLFIENKPKITEKRRKENFKVITYAGNIGESQGLHYIIPQAAAQLHEKFIFRIIGDGGAKSKLVNELRRHKVNNVELIPPIPRDELVTAYNSSDFLFIHLNNLPAFKKVLPSKVFELATFTKPLIAGVDGYAAEFIRHEIDTSIIFEPSNVDYLVKQATKYNDEDRYVHALILKYRRRHIHKKCPFEILNYIA